MRGRNQEAPGLRRQVRCPAQGRHQAEDDGQRRLGHQLLARPPLPRQPGHRQLTLDLLETIAGKEPLKGAVPTAARHIPAIRRKNGSGIFLS